METKQIIIFSAISINIYSPDKKTKLVNNIDL